MITNGRQYRILQAEVKRFEKSLAQAKEQNPDLSPRLRQAGITAIENRLQQLRRELADYDSLKRGKRTVEILNSLEDLPTALIRGRIASKLTQKQLAERLGVAEQQIQRWEITHYAGVSLDRIIHVASELGMRIEGKVFLYSPQEQEEERVFLPEYQESDEERVFSIQPQGWGEERVFSVQSREQEEQSREQEEQVSPPQPQENEIVQ